ncbi:MAG: hypothetical protein WA160_09310, partial [Pseudobdellovibrio sp.]
PVLDTTPAPAPVVLPLITKKIAVGAVKMFAINTSAVVKSAGANYDSSNNIYGQLGLNLGTSTNYNTLQLLADSPVQYVSVASGEATNCGITSALTIKCWGGYTGTGSAADILTPTTIDDSSTYNDVAAGSYHSCGVTTAGILKCWGDGWDGKLGNGDSLGDMQNSPVIADSGTLYKKVAAGRNHTCGITSADVLKCWGTMANGQVGNNSFASAGMIIPTIINAGTSYQEISAGEDTTCGITTAGVLKCWGYNSNGQLGDNTTVSKAVPTIIDSGVNYSKISTGGSTSYHTCGITVAGVLKCWGNNGNGQLGNASTTQSLIPVIIDAGTSYREVSVYHAHSCGITTGGTLKCWGLNTSGQLGSTLGGPQQTSPVTIGVGY